MNKLKAAAKRRAKKASMGTSASVVGFSKKIKKERVEELASGWTRITSDTHVFYHGPNGGIMCFPQNLNKREKDKRG